MPRQLVECVPNFCEGRDPAKVDAIVQAILAVPEVVLLDRESDADHNRCVLTFVGPPGAVADAAFRAVEKAVELIDLTKHTGAHPRIGAADVLPFIPIEGVTLEECVRLAERLGQEDVDEAAACRFTSTKPRHGGRSATIWKTFAEDSLRRWCARWVRWRRAIPISASRCAIPLRARSSSGARKFLIAYNVNLGTPDLAIAKRIAKTIRFSTGGFRYVKSMGVMLASRNIAQVSINLTDFEQTPMHLVFETVRREAERYGVSVVGSEIVGLIPKKAIEIVRRIFPALREFPSGAGAGESHRGSAVRSRRAAANFWMLWPRPRRLPAVAARPRPRQPWPPHSVPW